MTLLWQGGWTRWPTEVPSNPEHSVILWSFPVGSVLLFTFLHRNVKEVSQSIKAPFRQKEQHFTDISILALGHHSTYHSVGRSVAASFVGGDGGSISHFPRIATALIFLSPASRQDALPGLQLSFKASFFLYLFFFSPLGSSVGLAPWNNLLCSIFFSR